MLSDAQRDVLLRLARQVITTAVGGQADSRVDESAVPQMKAGAFVTVHYKGDLRGCIGYPARETPLGDVVRRCAVAAATEDPRFAPLRSDELSRVQIEISVLGPIEKVTDVNDIEVGRDGLIVGQGPRRGLLLPQVATEQGWDRDTFLAHTCLKAGLPADAWKRGAEIQKFEAEVFGEEEGAPSGGQ